MLSFSSKFRLICDVSRKQLSAPSAVTPTEASLLKLFPAVQAADDVRLSSGSTAQLDIAVVVGRGSIGHNDTVPTVTSTCDGVYGRCPVDAASLLQMVSDGGMSAEEAIALTNNVVEKK